MKIFLSSVSAQFKACRDALASDLRAIGCEVKVQEDFQQGSGSLIAQLENYVAQCDRVIALVGDAYGADSASDAIPPGKPPRSYTQWEYFFAIGERLRGPNVAPKDLLVYVASAEYLNGHPVVQSNIESERQQQFVALIKQSGKHRANFEGLDHLCRLVLRDGWQMNDRPAIVKPPFQLPRRALAGKLFGRQALVKRLAERLRNRENTDIWGPAGMGKTAVAAEAIFQIVDNNPANLAASPYPDGIVLLDLYSLKFESPDPAWHHLANSFDESIPTTQSAQDRAIQACRSRSALVIVEGAEEAKDGDRLQQLLSVLPAETVRLVLTRNKAQASSAKPLSVEAQLEGDDALALMREIWENQRDESVVAAVYDRFGGHPLALTWAASQLNAGEESPKTFLAGLNAETLPRINQPGYESHSLFWLFQRSAEHLKPNAKRILSAAGMLAQLPFPLGVAHAVLPDADLTTARAAMIDLVRHGLLRIAEVSDEQWEITHALTYQFARLQTDPTLLTPLGNWTKEALINAMETIKSSVRFNLLEQTLDHTRSLLRQDIGGKTLSVLAEYLRYAGQKTLIQLGRLDLLQVLIETDAEWLNLAGASDTDDEVLQRERYVNSVARGDAERMLGNLDFAALIFNQCLTDRTIRLTNQPTNNRNKRDLFLCLNKLGSLELSRANYVDAQKYIEQGHKVVKDLVAQIGDDLALRDLSISFNSLGDYFNEISDYSEARDHLKKAVRIREEFVTRKPKDWECQRDLSTSLNKLADVEMNDNQLDAAADLYERSVQISIVLANGDGSNSLVKRDLAVTFEKLAEIIYQLDRPVEARVILQSGIDISEQLVALDPYNALWRNDLARMKDRIERES